MRGALWSVVFLAWFAGAYACLLDDYLNIGIHGSGPPLPGISIPLPRLCPFGEASIGLPASGELPSLLR